MSRVILETREEHRAHLRMTAQRLRDGECVGLVALHSDRQGLQSPLDEKAVERGGYRAGRVLVETARLEKVLPIHDERAADHVAMPADILGGAVNHDVRAEVEGVLKVRACKGVVDGQERARCPERRHTGDVDDVEKGVGGRLQPDEPGPARQRRAERFHGMRADEPARDPILVVHAVEEPPRAAVDVARGNHLVAGFQQVEHGGRRRGPRCEAEAVRAVLCRGNGAFERPSAGVSRAPVFPPLARLFHTVLLEGRGEGDGDRDRSRAAVRLLGLVDDACCLSHAPLRA